jgi:hypothetical protein
VTRSALYAGNVDAIEQIGLEMQIAAERGVARERGVQSAKCKGDSPRVECRSLVGVLERGQQRLVARRWRCSPLLSGCNPELAAPNRYPSTLRPSALSALRQSPPRKRRFHPKTPARCLLRDYARAQKKVGTANFNACWSLEWSVGCACKKRVLEYTSAESMLAHWTLASYLWKCVHVNWSFYFASHGVRLCEYNES